MPTQEERLITLEQKFAGLRKETAASIQEVDENTTILLGVIRHQGQDIRRIFESLETINQRLDEQKALLGEHTVLLTQHTELLTQILARLPEKP